MVTASTPSEQRRRLEVIHEQCDKGITLRGLRRAFCGELKTNHDFVQVLGTAVGLPEVGLPISVTMKGHGEDLAMVCPLPDGDDVRIEVRVRMDSTTGAQAFNQSGEPYPVKAHTAGPRRLVTVGPAIWFCHRGNAASAQNMVLFNQLEEHASHDFWLALCQARSRADATFRELRTRKPKTVKPKVPWWVARRLRQGWQRY